MVTKAELEQELAALKEELAATRKKSAEAAAQTAEAAVDTGAEAAKEGKAALAGFLQSYGIDTRELDIEGLWRQLSGEIGDFSRRQPALAAIAVFGLGFLLGRMAR
ncbi:MAG: hypothetical protein ACK5MY_17710 [Jhaorihella sp.]